MILIQNDRELSSIQCFRALFITALLLGLIIVGETSIPFVYAQDKDAELKNLEEFLGEPPETSPSVPGSQPFVTPDDRLLVRLEAARIQADVEKIQLDKKAEVEQLKDWLRYGIAGMLVVTLVIVQVLVFKALSSRSDCTTRDLLNVMGLVLIIFSIVLIVIIADTEQQLTTSVGVLGTIAGYLFGSLRSGRRSNPQ